jgi:tetratricopeptide (TPR) repeat protein
VTADLLDPEARRDLRGLPRDLADLVARHLVAVGELVDDEPEAALVHARFARHLASRVAIVREAAGLAAYHAGEWAEALSELRASRRMGGDGHLPVMADAERALGRPERAIDLSRSPEARDLEPEEAVELLIVVSGARRDLGEHDAAVVGLQVPELDASRDEPWVPRLFYAYAEALQAAGRTDDAVRAFLEAARADVEGETDAEERAIMLGVGTGEVRTDEQTDATDATDHPDPAGDAEDERPAEDPADTAGSRG